MMSRNFPEYAALWREQIDPKELAELQTMATKIKRTAGRRSLLDHLLALMALGMICIALFRYPAPLLTKACLALFLLVLIWFVWKRRQITKASHAIAVHDPQVFFDAVIENVRAEINLSKLSAWLGVPAFIALCLLGAAERGFDPLFMNIRDMFTLASVKLTAVGVITIVGLIYLIRDNIKLREQLRRLEAMRREWEERDPGAEQ